MIRILATVATLILASLPSCAAAPALSRHAATPAGTLVFDDEFSGTTLDTNTWVALNRPGDASNNEQECYRPANATEGAGLLTITDRADTSCAGYAYTSAMVQTAAYSFTYGTLEVRAQMPRGTGQWPALWLLGANCQATNPTSPDNSGACQWPTPGSNEIDMFEGKGQVPSQGFFNLNTGTAPNSDNLAFGCNGVSLPFDTSAALHTYDLVWAPGSLQWQIDGATYCQTASNVPDTPMFPILNIALGGSFVGSIDPSALPQTMQVDYVRVYQQGAATPTDTPVPPTVTPIPPTATSTPMPLGCDGLAGDPTCTPTPVPPTDTPIPPTNTNTPAPPTATSTAVPVPSGYLGSKQITGGSFDTGDGNNISASRIVAGASGARVMSLSVYVGPVDTAHPQYGLAIYKDSSGHPGGLVAQAQGTLTGPGWNSLPLAATLAASTKYWLAYNEASANPSLNEAYLVTNSNTPGGYSGAVACCTFPGTASGWVIAHDQYALYASSQ